MEKFDRLTAVIGALLYGHEPHLQGMVLADLLATWLAGHVVMGDQEATDKLRAELLANHLSGLSELIAVNSKIGDMAERNRRGLQS